MAALERALSLLAICRVRENDDQRTILRAPMRQAEAAAVIENRVRSLGRPNAAALCSLTQVFRRISKCLGKAAFADAPLHDVFPGNARLEEVGRGGENLTELVIAQHEPVRLIPHDEPVQTAEGIY